MAQLLRVQPFSASLINCVRNFCCGAQSWEVEVANWIKDQSSDDCAFGMMQKRGTEVWLYRTDKDEVVGYGSLGKTLWKWPPPNGPKETVSIIPFFGVASAFQGEPKGAPPKERYAYQILGDLILKTRKHNTRLLGLFVDRQNVRARAFYERVGFQYLADDGKPNTRMFLDITDLGNADHGTPP